MAEKHLTEAAWKAFDKDKKYKADALAKAMRALTALDKGGTGLAGEKLKALDEIDEEAASLRKANKGDKALAAYLDDLDKALVRQRKETEREAAQEKAAEDEEESPALLTTKMVPLLREVRKGDLVLQVLIAVAGKETVLLLSRKAISPARGKLLKEQMTNPGGLKFLRGECQMEDGKLTFVMQSPATGLAKRIKAALLAQVELRLNVRVRGEEGDVEEVQEGEGEGEAAPGPGAGTTASTGTPQSVDEARPSKVDEGAERLAAFNARLAALMPRIKQALAGAGPTASSLKLSVSEAGALARQARWDGASAQLDAIEAMLAAAGDAPRPPSGDGGGQTRTASPDDYRAAAKDCLKLWLQAKEASDAGLSRLQSALRSEREPALDRIAEFGLAGVSRGLQVKMRVALQEFGAQGSAQAAGKLRSSVAEMHEFLKSDPAVRLCDDNPFGIAVDLRPTFGAALEQINARLDTLAA